jgi:hypothetical protein
MSSQSQNKNENGDINQNKGENNNNKPEETEKEENKKKYKSKFSLLDQGRIMLIGNMEEVSKNLIIVGPKSSGKSSIFSLLTTGSPNTYYDNGTCGINFGFMRTQNSVQKKVMNVYEIGSELENLSLIKTILNNDNFESTFLFLVLDFENPYKQLSYLLKYISNLQKIINEIIDVNIVENNIKNRIMLYPSNKRPDSVNVFPIETFVIGNKYDALETIDIEKLKWLCPSLRYFCYVNALNLIFYSSKKKETINSLYNTVAEVAFGSGKRENLKKYIQKNSTKPLYINYYNDNLDDIGEPKIPVTVTGVIEQRWKETYDGLFKNYRKNEENSKYINLDQEYYQLYKESKIDHELDLFNNYKEKNELNEKNNNINKKNNMDNYNKNRMRKKK